MRSAAFAPVLALGGDSLPIPTPTEPPARLFLAIKHSPPSKEESILGLRPGDVVTYFDQDRDWYWGQLGGVEGWFDPTCVKEITHKMLKYVRVCSAVRCDGT